MRVPLHNGTRRASQCALGPDLQQKKIISRKGALRQAQDRLRNAKKTTKNCKGLTQRRPSAGAGQAPGAKNAKKESANAAARAFPAGSFSPSRPAHSQCSAPSAPLLRERGSPAQRGGVRPQLG